MDIERVIVEGSHERVLAVGFGEPGVTVAEQQRRALNLVEWLQGTGDTVAVVGGGVAGVTLMAAASMAGVECTLFEQADRTLQLFEQNTTRLIHPHFYDWPREGWRRQRNGVPVLDWRAGSGRQVVAQLSQGFDAVCTTYELHDRIRLRARVVGLVARPDSVDIEVEDQGSHTFGRVVLCVGFGLEANLDEFGSASYWDDRTLGRPRPDGKRTPLLISGCGDGGVIDFLRARIQPDRSAEVDGNHAVDQVQLAALVDDCFPGMHQLKQRLIELDEQGWALFDRVYADATAHGQSPREATHRADAESGEFLLFAYADLATHPDTADAVAAVDDAIKKRGLRAETEDTRLNDSKPSPLRLSAFILNRFLCFRVLVLDGLEVVDRVMTNPGPYLQGRLTPGDATNGGWHTVGDQVFDPKLTLVRHGPKRGARFTDFGLTPPVHVGRDPNAEAGWERASDEDDSERWALHLALMKCVGGSSLDLARCLVQFLRRTEASFVTARRGREDAGWEAHAEAMEEFEFFPHRITPAEGRRLVALSQALWLRLSSASLVAWVLARAMDDSLGRLGELQREFGRQHARLQDLSGVAVLATVRPVDDSSSPWMLWVRVIEVPDDLHLRISMHEGELKRLRHVAALIPPALPADWEPPAGGPGMLVAPVEADGRDALAAWAARHSAFGACGSPRMLHSFCCDQANRHQDLGDPRGSAATREVLLYWDRLGRSVCAFPADHVKDGKIRQVVVGLAPCLAVTVASSDTLDAVKACGAAVVELGGELVASFSDGETLFQSPSREDNGPTTIAVMPWRIRTLSNS